MSELKIPKPKSSEEAPIELTAQKIALAVQAKRTKRKAVQEAIEAGVVYGFACNRSIGLNPPHAGIILLANPVGKAYFHGGEWISAYHPKPGPIHDYSLNAIVCQECWLEDGERKPLKLEYAKGKPSEGVCFRISPKIARRHVWALQKSEVEAILAEMDAAMEGSEEEPQKAAPAKGLDSEAKKPSNQGAK